MKFFGFLVLLCFLLIKGNSHTLNEKYYDIIRAALAHYRSRCAILIYDGSGKQWEIRDMVAFLNLQKLISYNNFYFSSLMTLPALSKVFRNARPWMRETIAVLEFNENIIHFLLKASNESAMTSYKWFFTTSSASHNLDKLTIPADSEFIIAHGNPEEGYEISETYNVDHSKKLTKTLGSWTIGDRFHLNASTDLFTRRQNLEGAVIKIASPKKDPCSNTSFFNTVDVFVWCIYQTIWEAMEEMLNATTETSVVRRMTLKFLENSDVDFTFRSTPMNSMDMNTRSYLWPVFRARVMVVTSYLTQEVEWKSYILPFSNELWYIILAWVVTCDLILTIVELIAKEMNRSFLSLYCSEFSFATAFTLCNQGVLGPSKLTGIRIIFTVMFVIPAVLFPGYSAVLTSFLTIQLHKKPFQSLEELSQLKDYKIGWHRSFSRRYLFNLQKDMSPLDRALLTNNVLPEDEMPTTEAESIERLCKEKFVFLTILETVWALKPKCSYYALKQYFRLIFTGMEIKKNSWYKYFMDRCLRHMSFTGIMDRIRVNSVIEYINYNKILFVEKETVFQPIKMENIILPFAVLLLGVVSSLFLLALEVICFKQNSTPGQQQRRLKRVKKHIFINCL